MRTLNDVYRVDLQAAELVSKLDDAIGGGGRARPGESLLGYGETTRELEGDLENGCGAQDAASIRRRTICNTPPCR